jgi:hypothetical protein
MKNNVENALQHAPQALRWLEREAVSAATLQRQEVSANPLRCPALALCPARFLHLAHALYLGRGATLQCCNPVRELDGTHLHVSRVIE